MGFVVNYLLFKYTACFRWSSSRHRTFSLGTKKETDACMAKKASLAVKYLKHKTKKGPLRQSNKAFCSRRRLKVLSYTDQYLSQMHVSFYNF